MLKLILQISKGLIRDEKARRTLMFYATLGALLMLFSGATFLDKSLREHPFVFLGFWAACAWITLLATLLAFFDVLMVRIAARQERRRLEREALEEAASRHDETPG